MEKVQWSALEYEEKERDRNWFWTLGVIVFTSAAAALIYGNYFFAGFLVLSGILLAFFAIRKPELVHYELNQKGFAVESRLYPYENIKAFWVQRSASEPEVLKPMLFIHSERIFMPIVVVHTHDDMADHIRTYLLDKKIPEEE